MGENQREPQQLRPFLKLKNSDGTEKVHYSFLYEGVPSEFKTVAKQELNETEEMKWKGVQKLRDVLKRESVTDIEDTTIMAILRNCKYDFRKSETKLKKFLKIQNMVIKLLREADMGRLESVLEYMAIGFLPYRDKHGRAILFTRPNFNFELFDLNDAAICFYSCMLFALTFPLTSITGVAYIAVGETTNISTRIYYEITKLYRQHMSNMLNLPIRVARVDILYENFIIRWTYNILRPLISSKIGERVDFYGSDVQRLQKLYHPALLPEEFGGTMGSLSPAFYKEELLKFMNTLKSRSLQ